MKFLDNIIRGYAKTVVKHPIPLLTIVLLLSAAAFSQMSNLKTKAMNTRDMLPKNTPVIDSMNYLEDEFGGSETGMVVLKLSPSENQSNEVRDIRDLRAIKYADILSQKISMLDGIQSSSSIADIIKNANGGRMPQTRQEIKNIISNSQQASLYISGDYTMSLIKFTIVEGADEKKLTKEIRKIISETNPPAGVTAEETGSFAISTAIQERIAPDMGKTGMISFIGIAIIILLLFKSIKYGFASMTAIIFGNIWTFGFLGFLGNGITSATAGAASMIMGIGIDFGIQVVSRYRHELTRNNRSEAMIKTISEVTIPMMTTTIAALIGFRAMTMGKLSIMGELGTMMSLGVFFCMLAALTVVPSLILIFDKHSNRGVKK